jgi:predicted O-linked N-acetylglucosamine transferase (SPINDLY family)
VPAAYIKTSEDGDAMTRKFHQRQRPRATVNPLLPEAVALHQAGRLEEADAVYEQIIAESPNNFDALHLHGVIALQQERFDKAEEAIKSALSINPRDAGALTNLGTIYLRTGRLEAARGQFERALQAQPNSPDALLNLGTALHQLKRPRQAVIPLKRAFAMNTRSATLCNLLGACLLETNEIAEAVKVFETATRAEPNTGDCWANLSVALTVAGESARASECAQRAIALAPRSSAALAALASVQLRENRIDEAIATYWEAVDMPNASNQTRCAFAIALLGQDMFDDAIDQLRQALDLDSNNLLARWLLAMAQCKPSLETSADIELARVAFSDHLTELDTWLATANPTDSYIAVGSFQPFYLAYQHFNNRELLTRYGRLCTRCMQTFPSAAPETKAKRDERTKAAVSPPRKLRVGIVSAHVSSHSVWIALTKGIIKHLDRSRFDLHLFQLDPKSDAETAWAKHQVVQHEDRHKDLKGWVGAIRSANLDVIIYPEVGMDAVTAQLAALRLAPIQATTWGHPETSGLPTIDIYFSADRLEPVNSHHNYSERLICLPNLGACVEPWIPTMSIPDLPALGVSGKEPLLLCPGKPFKYSPVHDRLWARIAKGLRANGAGRLVFFLAAPTELNQRLKLRLRRAFREERQDFDKQVYLLPFLPRPEFFGLMQHSALMLDTLGFSGFNTAIQGIEAGLPVLAREGNFMRGRLASGILRHLDLPELVARTDEEFIEMAVKLTGDPSKRKQLGAEIEKRRPILFNDVEPIRALERHLLELAG